MSQNMEREDVVHELLIRRDAEDDESSSQQSLSATTLNLSQGENWLRLVVSLNTSRVLFDTQETSVGTKPFPTITSLSEVGSIKAPTDDCYICVDVDGKYATIKDMRNPLTPPQDTEEEELFQVFLQRRKEQHEKLASLADSQTTEGDADDRYQDMEELERRQLRMLRQGDLVVVTSGAGGESDRLVLEHRQRSGEPRSRCNEEMTEASLEVVEEEPEIQAAASGEDTQASRPSDLPQTQPEDPTPQSSSPEYKTATEQQTQESYDDDSTSDGEDADATQVFPPPFQNAKSVEEDKGSDGETPAEANPPGNVMDQSILNYHSPANEEQVIRQKESMTGQGNDESAEFSMGTQPEGEEDGESGGGVDTMDESTQSIPEQMPKNASQGTTDGDKDGTTVKNKIGGSEMPPIVEEAEAQTPVTDGDKKAGEEPPSQASTTLDDSKKDANETDSDSDVSESQGDPVENDDIDESDSDALLDDDDIKDASADVKDTPQKPKGGDDTRAAGVDKPQAPAAPAEEGQMSDSSSITEVDEKSPKKSIEKATKTERTTQKEETAPATENSAGPKDDASNASSLTEADDMASPHKGLVTLSREGKDAEAPTNQASLEEPSAESTVQKDEEDVTGSKQSGTDGDETSNVPNEEDAAPQVDKDDDKKVDDDKPAGEANEAVKGVVVAEEKEADGVESTNRVNSSKRVSSQANDDDDDDDETVGDDEGPSDKANEAGEAVGAVQEAPTSKVSTQADDDDETAFDEGEQVETTQQGTERSMEKPTETEASQTVEKEQGVSAELKKMSSSAPVPEDTDAEADTVEDNQSADHGEATIGTHTAGAAKEETEEPATETFNEDVEVEETVTDDVKEMSEKPRSEERPEDDTVTEVNKPEKEKHSPEEPSESFAHSADTEVTDNRSPAVDKKETPSAKDEAETPVAVESLVEEVKGIEEAEAPGGQSSPPTNQADAVKPSASVEEEEEKPKAAKPPKKRKHVPEDAETTETKVPRRARSTRRKASPVPEQEDQQQEEEESSKTPAKKRSTRRKATPKEEEPQNDESLKTPARKRGRAGVAVRSSARKRTRGAAATPMSPGEGPVLVLMTGVGETDKHKKMVASIGGEVIEKIQDAHKATHVIAGDDKTTLRRTPKLMIGMCRTSKIVHMNWLVKSAKVREPLACNDFLLLKDKKAEKTYDFVMREALQRGDELRRNGEFLLSDYWVYVCKGVGGNKAPPEKEFELIVDAAGGTWLSSISTRTMKDVDASKLIIIAPEKPVKKAKTTETKDVEKALKLGAQSHPASWLFRCIIRQSLDD